MNVTSHFIGIKIKNEAFVNLFTTLQQYITKNNLSLFIELQNINSLHVSLYYLPRKISSQERISIKDTLEALRTTYTDFVLTKNKFAYFMKNESEYLCYISCAQVKELEQINTLLGNQYQKTEVADNQYTYIPHISLFKILNHDIFLQYKDYINSILTQGIENIKGNMFQGFFLYEVDSNLHPEMQRIAVSFY